MPITADTVPNAGHWIKRGGISNTTGPSSANTAELDLPGRQAPLDVSYKEGRGSGGAVNNVRVAGWPPEIAGIKQTGKIYRE